MKDLAHAALQNPADFDKRRVTASPSTMLEGNRVVALEALQNRIPGVRVDLDDILGSPRFVHNRFGLLTGPAEVGDVLHPKAGQPEPEHEAMDSHQPIRTFLDENAELFGHDSTLLNAFECRALVTFSIPTMGSPNGWINEDVTRYFHIRSTVGNNIDVHIDLHANNPEYDGLLPFPTPPRPIAQIVNGVLTFDVPDYPMDLSMSPFVNQPGARNQDNAVINAFYWCNWLHDRFYELGFTEAAGNFQQDNFGRGGVGGDAVLVDVQDGPIADYSASPVDGVPARIRLGTWPGSNRDK